MLGPLAKPLDAAFSYPRGRSEDQTSKGGLEPHPVFPRGFVLPGPGRRQLPARPGCGAGRRHRGEKSGEDRACRAEHRLPRRLGKQAARTGVDNSTISYLRVKNKLHPKEFHTQHPTKLTPSKTTQVLVRVPLSQPWVFGKVRAAPGVRGAGGVGWGWCSPARRGGCCRFFRVLEESGVAASGCPGAGKLLLVFIEAEA